MDEQKLATSNVTSINERKNKRAKLEVKPPGRAELYRGLADAINKSAVNLLPDFPQRYLVLEPEYGVRLPLLLDPTEESVRLVKKEAVANDLLVYGESLGMSEYAMTWKQAKEAADYWLASTRPTEADKIRAVRWKGDPGLTYRRLPWDKQDALATPTWEEMLSRMTNAHAFCQWVGSLFFDESDLQSYVWCYGAGGEGKGSINRFLARVFGPSYRSRLPPGKEPKFWAYGLIGARVVVFPDSGDAKFVSEGLFKSLTGGDPVEVEAKGAMSFTTKLNAKYLVISNEKPSLSSERADMRRVIYCEMSPPKEVMPNFEDLLWEEGGAFLTNCCQEYLAYNPTHGAIKADLLQVESLVSENEEHFEEFFAKNFVADKSGHVAPGVMQKRLDDEWPRNRTTQREFRRWLERSHGIRKKRVRIDNDTLQRRYEGLKTLADVALNESFYS